MTILISNILLKMLSHVNKKNISSFFILYVCGFKCQCWAQHWTFELNFIKKISIGFAWKSKNVKSLIYKLIIL